MSKYTINTVMATGKVDNTYGSEYHVKFAESPDTFKLWYQKEPQQGQVQYGEIDGSKFKKQKPPQQQTDGGTFVPKKTRSVIEAEKSDGQRQGMCFNNAANFVNGTLNSTGEVVSPEQWAKMVFTHAKALYSLGDLTKDVPETEEQTVDAPKSVQEVFGVTKAVPANG